MGFSWSETDQPNFLTTGGDMNLCSASDASSTIFFFQKPGTLGLPNPRDQAFFFYYFYPLQLQFFHGK
jgi:hypothetical protein